MNRTELEARTKRFAVAVVEFVAELPRSSAADIIGRQLLRAGTSVGANYREANRAESHADFLHKIGIVEKEASEAQYWVELLEATGLGNRARRAALLDECSQLLAIFTAVGRTGRSRHPAPRPATRPSPSKTRNRQSAIPNAHSET